MEDNNITSYIFSKSNGNPVISMLIKKLTGIIGNKNLSNELFTNVPYCEDVLDGRILDYLLSRKIILDVFSKITDKELIDKLEIYFENNPAYVEAVPEVLLSNQKIAHSIMRTWFNISSDYYAKESNKRSAEFLYDRFGYELFEKYGRLPLLYLIKDPELTSRLIKEQVNPKYAPNRYNISDLEKYPMLINNVNLKKKREKILSTIDKLPVGFKLLDRVVGKLKKEDFAIVAEKLTIFSNLKLLTISNLDIADHFDRYLKNGMVNYKRLTSVYNSTKKSIPVKKLIELILGYPLLFKVVLVKNSKSITFVPEFLQGEYTFVHDFITSDLHARYYLEKIRKLEKGTSLILDSTITKLLEFYPPDQIYKKSEGIIEIPRITDLIKSKPKSARK